jgi:hypothetical protein
VIVITSADILLGLLLWRLFAIGYKLRP